MIWDEELIGYNVSCKACSTGKHEVLSFHFAALSHILMGALQYDVSSVTARTNTVTMEKQ